MKIKDFQDARKRSFLSTSAKIASKNKGVRQGLEVQVLSGALQQKMKIWIDGSGWNGRESKFAVVFEDGRIVQEATREKKTNNVMEYESLIKALESCKEGDEIFTDSQLLVGHVGDGLGQGQVLGNPLVPCGRILDEPVFVDLDHLGWLPLGPAPPVYHLRVALGPPIPLAPARVLGPADPFQRHDSGLPDALPQPGGCA